jgi:hypothetical protein
MWVFVAFVSGFFLGGAVSAALISYYSIQCELAEELPDVPYDEEDEDGI